MTYNKWNAYCLTDVIMIHCLRASASNNLHSIQCHIHWYYELCHDPSVTFIVHLLKISWSLAHNYYFELATPKLGDYESCNYKNIIPNLLISKSLSDAFETI